MKQKLHFILFLILANLSYSQNNNFYEPKPKFPYLFKSIIPIQKDDPKWIQLMYGETPNVYEIEKEYNLYYKKHDFVKTIHTQNYKHFIHYVYTNNWINEKGDIVQRDNMVEKKEERLNSNKSINAANWTPIGPINTFNNGGTKTESHQANVYSVAQSVSNPNVLFCVTETSGTFKSTDKGENWFLIGGDYFNDDVSCVEVDPTNENNVFVASSSRIYKSTDGGNSWNSVLNVSGLGIYEFAISSANNQLVFAAGNKGLYKSTNGGTTWTQVFTETCWDVKFKTNDASTVFLLKSNNTLKLTEFYKSTDSGNTFTLKKQGWFTPTSTSSIGGARMGVTNADGNRIYVAMLGNVENYTTDVNFVGLYRSDDAGENWSLPYDQNNDGIPNNNPGGPYNADHWCFSSFTTNGDSYNQGFYNLAIDVSDTDPNKFLMGMLNLFKSENGGKTYTRWGGYACDNCTPFYRHPDHQDILINGNDVFVATDGGVDLYDSNLNILKGLNKGIISSDNWGFGQGWNEDVLTAGRYHNGNAVYHANYGDGKFIALGGGESSTGYVSLGDNLKVYHSDIAAYKISKDFATPVQWTNGLSMFPNESIFPDVRGQITYDPRYYNHMYLTKDNKLWKSIDGGASFTLLKEFGISTDKTYTVEVSRLDPNIMFVVTREASAAKLWKTLDGGQNWSSISLPNTDARLYFSINENNTLFIGFGGGSGKAFKSIDLGNTWINLTTPSIQNLGCYSIAPQLGTNDGVYFAVAGTNKIYYRNSNMPDWELFSTGLPLGLRLIGAKPFYKNNELRISSRRGFWKSPLFEKSAPVAQPMVANKSVDCSKTIIQFDDYSVLNHTGAQWNWNFPGASNVSSTSVRNPLVTYSTPGLFNVTLTITDADGRSSTKTVQNMIEVLPSICDIENASKQVLEMNTDTQSITSNEINYPAVTDLTFSGWIKPNGTQVAWAGIACFGDKQKTLLNFRSANNEIGFHFKDGYYNSSTGLYAPADQWSFIAFRITPTKITIFLNDKNWSITGSFASTILNKIILGKDYGRNDRTFKGQMEEFTFWNRALTDDEIYLSRHLIKEKVTDPNLIAYYQFNNTTNNGLLYDKINSNNLNISSTILFPTSTAPVAIGTSQLLTINTTGSYNFTTTNATLNFTGQVPNGKVIVSKLNVIPNEPPTTELIGNEYWILDNYGTNSSFSGLSSINLTPLFNVSNLNPSNLILFKRNNNGHLQSSWTQSAMATALNGQTITFPGTSINQSNQLHIGSSASLETNSLDLQKNLTVYPNPTVVGEQLIIEGINSGLTFTLYDINGKLIIKKHLDDNKIRIDNNIKKGVYFYRIETNDRIYNNKLIIN
ncbi:LamG-like jellyroll fold domain-containing protein [Flavobacterium oreochromis]|uniref:LamG-like jellyroll fold domain-containing protein n=1 Tax=Flavobacterium oreochromis TaxID=2906078 RepID=UPI00385ACBBF